jgi:hypothetical protein
MSAAVLGISAVASQPAIAQEWRPVRGGMAYGISGMATVRQQPNAIEMLVVHDNKKPDQGRLGLVAIAGFVQPQYTPIPWQPGAELPIDLEGLTAVPDTATYMAMTSAGRVFHFSLDRTNQTITVLNVFDVPKLPAKTNLEGFAVAPIAGSLVAVWAHRGEGSDPGVLYWGTLDLTRATVTLLGQAPITVPIADAQTRHISDCKVDAAGVVYITAASDNGDDGPFRSAAYVAGVIQAHGKALQFHPNSALVPLWRDNYHKVEAIELVPGADGGVVFGTDDESMGSSVVMTGSP